ncbi:hypothetical protein B5F29_02820 [Lachnoclostridium sp. An196]|uniref:hypothetical protein n=1 Tax=Lachnoclostridium sp. An196 TaxID=1965583 RepID=UPI000B3A66A4|nr:hypothetical protein [Lachnoclostridium sp. An196]OUP21432.1 hypothetical protein B5F29_02820 [Lachnoclostridium sp. An196]
MDRHTDKREWNKNCRGAAGVLNRLLMLSFCPLLWAGVHMLFDGSWCAAASSADGAASFWPGILVGYVSGIVLHELAHVCACLAYGGRVLGGGLMFRYFIPQVYVNIDWECVRSRLKRVQILAAGIECNFALAGFFLLLLKTGLFSREFLQNAATVNFILGVLNTSLADGLDGMQIYEQILGEENMVRKARRLLGDRESRRRLRSRKVNGYAVLLQCYLTVGMQLLLPLYLIFDLLSLCLIGRLAR